MLHIGNQELINIAKMNISLHLNHLAKHWHICQVGLIYWKESKYLKVPLKSGGTATL